MPTSILSGPAVQLVEYCIRIAEKGVRVSFGPFILLFFNMNSELTDLLIDKNSLAEKFIELVNLAGDNVNTQETILQILSFNPPVITEVASFVDPRNPNAAYKVFFGDDSIFRMLANHSEFWFILKDPEFIQALNDAIDELWVGQGFPLYQLNDLIGIELQFCRGIISDIYISKLLT